jgi:hypothetical protein
VNSAIVAYLDGLSPAGDLRNERGKELPVPTLFVGGSFGAAAAGRVAGGVAPSRTLRSAAPWGDDVPQGDDACVGYVMCMSDRVHWRVSNDMKREQDGKSTTQ